MVLFRRNGVIEMSEATVRCMQSEIDMLRQENAELREQVEARESILREQRDELRAIKRAWGMPDA